MKYNLAQILKQRKVQAKFFNPWFDMNKLMEYFHANIGHTERYNLNHKLFGMAHTV